MDFHYDARDDALFTLETLSAVKDKSIGMLVAQLNPSSAICSRAQKASTTQVS
jgi:hypothetical protein